ncbi:LysR family transcriptional regulator [Streptococcus pneumoniae]|nr:LysR family transcriptional regulator [Streptococcus pneumoniae]
MYYKDLEYFCALVKEGSYTTVAQQFKVTQPTVSYAIKRLEEELACQLLQRDTSRRRISPTEQGDILLQYAQIILFEIEKLKIDIRQSLVKKPPIGFPPIISHYVFEKIENLEKGKSFLACIRPIRDGSVSLLKQLMQGDLSMSFIGSLDKIDLSGFIVKEFCQKEFKIVVSKNHPLASNHTISFLKALEYPFVLLNEHNIHLNAFKKLNEKYDHKANVLVSLNDVQIVKQLVAKGLGISLLTSNSLGEEDKELVAINLEKQDCQRFRMSYIYRENSQKQKEVEDFLELLGTIDW